MKEVSVGFQGEPGAYSEEAVLQHFGDAARPVPFRTLYEVFESVSRGDTDAGMIPVENSIGGNVYESYDLLISSELTVTAEVYLRVHHCLIGKRGASVGGVRKVYSHPQALEQCRSYLSSLGVEMHSSYDTAGSLAIIRDGSAPDTAAVASARAAGLYGLEIIARNVEDNPNNTTRFLVISRGATASPEGKCKTSIVFQVPNTPGSLVRAMGLFATRGLNLTKIESRPVKEHPWDYYFLMDFEGSASEVAAADALGDLRRTASFVRVIGCYPRVQHH